MKCNDCPLISDDTSLFVKDSTRPLGFKNCCKKCQTIRTKNNRIKNREKLYINNKIRYKKEKELGIYIYRKNQNLIKDRAYEMRHAIVGRIRTKNIEVDEMFTSKYFENILLTLTNCPCCGIKFEYRVKSNSEKASRNNATPSVDRLDSSKGYIKNNVKIICWRCNHLKGDGTINNFELIVNWLKLKC